MTHVRTTVGQTTGFTLLEMLVVIAIAALLSGIAFPAIDRAVKAQAFRTAAVQIELAVRRAQADAIREQRTTTAIPLTPGDRRTKVELVRGLFGASPAIERFDVLRFYRDGTASGGVIQVASGSHRFRISVSAETGVISSVAQ